MQRWASVVIYTVLIGVAVASASALFPDGYIFYQRSATNTIMGDNFTGTDFTASNDVLANVGGVPNWIEAQWNHKRNESIVMVQDANLDVNIVVINMTRKTTLFTTEYTASTPIASSKTMDMAYESVSGRGLVVWDNNTADQAINYSIWNGTGMIVNSSIALTTTSTTRHFLRLYPDANSNKIMLIYNDAQSDLGAILWTGTAWVNATTITADSTVATNRRPFDFAWYQNGSGIVFFADPSATGVSYSEFDSATGAWSAETVALGIGATPQALDACANPNNDFVGFITTDSGGDANAFMWNGTGIDPGRPGEDTGIETGGHNSRCEWESSGLQAVFLFADSNALTIDNFHYNLSPDLTSRNWSVTDLDLAPTSAFAADDIQNIKMRPSPYSDIIMVTEKDLTTLDTSAILWNGTAIGAALTNGIIEGSSATAAVQSYEFIWNRFLSNPPTFLGPVNDTSNMTNPTAINLNVTFRANASDPEGNQWYMLICTGNEGTLRGGCYGTELCRSGLVNNNGGANCSHNTSGEILMNYSWHAYACDNNSVCSGAENTSAPYVVNIGPTVNSITITPSRAVNGSAVNISTNVTDPQGVNTVIAELLYPNGTVWQNRTLNGSNPYTGLFTAPATPAGNYTVRIWSNDTNSSVNNTANTTFTPYINMTRYADIAIDGAFTDWAAVENITDDAEGVAGRYEITSISTAYADRYLFVRLRISGPFTPTDFYRVYFGTDGSGNTSTPRGATTPFPYTYLANASGNTCTIHNKTGQQVGTCTAANNTQEMEMSVPLSAINVTGDINVNITVETSSGAQTFDMAPNPNSYIFHSAPLLNATVGVRDPWYFPDETVNASGTLAWMNGTPVAGGTVTVTFTNLTVTQSRNVTTNSTGGFSDTFAVPTAANYSRWYVNVSGWYNSTRFTNASTQFTSNTTALYYLSTPATTHILNKTRTVTAHSNATDTIGLATYFNATIISPVTRTIPAGSMVNFSAYWQNDGAFCCGNELTWKLYHNDTLICQYGDDTQGDGFSSMSELCEVTQNIFLRAGDRITYLLNIYNLGEDLSLHWDANFETGVQFFAAESDPPLISSIAQNFSATRANISWTTGELANGSVRYGTTTALTDGSNGSETLTIGRNIWIYGLAGNTVYYYNITSCDVYGNCNTTGPNSFTTLSSINVTQCMTLDESNTQYRLTQNLTQFLNCIVIPSSNVSFNGQGYMPYVTDPNSAAITVSGFNVTIHNTTFRNGTSAIQLAGSVANLTITNNTFFNVTTAHALDFATNVTITNNQYRHSRGLTPGHNSLFENNTVVNISLDTEGYQNVTIRANLFANNNVSIALRIMGDNVNVTGNTFTNVSQAIYVESGNSIRIVNNSINDSDIAIRTEGGTSVIGGNITNARVAFDGIFSGQTIQNVTLVNTSEFTVVGFSPVTFIDMNIGNYSIDIENATQGAPSLIFEKSAYGRITFVGRVAQSSTNLSDDIEINFNNASVNSSKTGLNRSANITLYNVPVFANPAIFRDSDICPSTVCYNFTSLTAGTVVFNVSGWSDFSIQATPTVSAASPANDSVIDRDELQADPDFVLLNVSTTLNNGKTVTFKASLTSPSIAGQSGLTLGTNTTADGYAVFYFNPASNTHYAGNYTWWGENPSADTLDNRTFTIRGTYMHIYRDSSLHPNSTYLYTDTIRSEVNLTSSGLETLNQLNASYSASVSATALNSTGSTSTVNLPYNGTQWRNNTLALSTLKGAGVWNHTVASTASWFYTPTDLLRLFTVYSFMNVTSNVTAPTSIFTNDYTTMTCRVNEQYTNYSLQNINVTFYLNSTLVGSNLTNASGYASLSFTSTAAGTFTTWCNVTDQLGEYYYRGAAPSGNATITVTDNVPPAFSAVNATVNATRANVTWTNNEAANRSIQYGTTTALALNTTNSIAFTTSHEQMLYGLTPATLYYYNITSCDASGNCNTTGPYNFTTLAYVNVSACTILDEENVTYYLTQNITNVSECFTLASSYAIFEGNGYTVSANTTPGSGFSGAGGGGIIRNVRLVDFAIGIGLADTLSLTMSNITVITPSGGSCENIHLDSTVYVELINSTIIANSGCIGVDAAGTMLVLENNSIQAVGDGAFGLATGTGNNAISSTNNTYSGTANSTAVYVGTTVANFTNDIIASADECAVNVSTGAGAVNRYNNVTITSGGFCVTQGNSTIFNQSTIGNYSFPSAGAKIVVMNQYGSINFTQGINGSGTNLNADIRILFNNASVNSTNTGLNRSANVTLYSIPPLARPRIFRNEDICSSAICYNFTALEGTVIFNVTGWTDFSIQSTPTISVASPAANTVVDRDEAQADPDFLVLNISTTMNDGKTVTFKASLTAPAIGGQSGLTVGSNTTESGYAVIYFNPASNTHYAGNYTWWGENPSADTLDNTTFVVQGTYIQVYSSSAHPNSTYFQNETARTEVNLTSSGLETAVQLNSTYNATVNAQFTNTTGSNGLAGLAFNGSLWSGTYALMTLRGVGPWNNTIISTAYWFYTPAQVQRSFTVTGYMNITTNSTNPSTLNRTEYATTACRVQDQNTNYDVVNANVTFYRDGVLLGSNLTDSSGYAQWSYQMNAVGTYTITCNVSDQPTIFYYRGTVPEHNSTLTIVSNPPMFAGSVNDSSNATSPTNEGSSVTFTANATDLDDDSWRLIICSTSTLTGTDCAAVNYCNSSATTSGSYASCSFNTTGLVQESYNWSAFACDTSDRCSSYNNDTSPFVVNHAPSVLSVTISPLLPNVTSTLTCNPSVSDPDSSDIVTPSYTWYSRDEGTGAFQLISGQTASTLGAGLFDSNDEIACAVTPTDDHGFSGSAVNGSAAISRGNLSAYSTLAVSQIYRSLSTTINVSCGVNNGDAESVFVVLEDNRTGSYAESSTVFDDVYVNQSNRTLGRVSQENSTNATFIIYATTAGNYSFRAVCSAADAAPVSVTSVAQTLSVTLDTTPPVISSVLEDNIEINTATIVWITDDMSDSTVEYGPTADNLNGSVVNPADTTSHSIVLINLLPNTDYYYNVTSCNVDDFCSTSGPYMFTTQATDTPGSSFEDGYCTARVIEPGPNYQAGYVSKGDIVEFYCEMPHRIKEREGVTLTLTNNEKQMQEKIDAPNIITGSQVVLYP